MQLTDFLSRKNVCLGDVVAEAQARLQPVPGDVLFVCGSLVEGIGNETSDIDLYLVTSRNDIQFTSLDAVLLAVGACLIDVRVVTHVAVESLLKRFDAWSQQPRQPRAALAICYEDRIFLHRLHTGQALYGTESFEYLRRQVDVSQLARHKLDWARCYADGLQVDLAGLRRDGDRYTMLFTAQEVLAHAVDAILAGHQETNPNGKWRVRQLGNLSDGLESTLLGRPIGRSLRDHFLSLHRAPERDDSESVHAHALRIVAFARQAFFWVERRLVAPRTAPPPTIEDQLASEAGGRRLPHLDLDVTIRGDTLELFRLHGSGEVITLSCDSAALLCLFDGETSEANAIRIANRLCGEGQGIEVVSQLRGLVADTGLAASPLLDQQMLERLLGRS